jgi:hypothetical protein
VLTELLCATTPLGYKPVARLIGAVELSGITAQLRGINTHMNTLADLLSSRVKAEVFRLLFGNG